MELKEIERNIEHIESRNYQELQVKREKILRELDYLLDAERDLLKIKSRYEILKKIIETDESMIRMVIDENHGFRLGREFEPILDKMESYNEAYYNFMFHLHEKICAPNLYSKQMKHFNYQIPTGFDPYSRPTSGNVNSDSIIGSESIDTEFYQIELLRYWTPFINEKNYELSYNQLCDYFLNNYGSFRFSDIAVTSKSNGVSRVENSLNQIRKVFRKSGIINKADERITIFGVFIVKIMSLAPDSNNRELEDYRGIKSENKLLAKPINDMLFNFDMNNYDKLKISRKSFDKLEKFLHDYKENPKNIAIYNMPDYLKHQ
jgi:hypothetical protein